jgi:hypothetical protein
MRGPGVYGDHGRPRRHVDLPLGLVPWLGAVVSEVLGLIVLSVCPLLVVGCHLAQEGSGAWPSVGDLVGPCSVLRGELAFRGATACQGPRNKTRAVELSAVQARLELLRTEVLHQVTDWLR